MSTEAPALSIQFGNFRFHIGAGPTHHMAQLQTLRVSAQCTPDTWNEVQWPSDDELQKLLGLPVRFLDGGPGPYEALYAVGEVPDAPAYYEAMTEGLDVFTWSPAPPGTANAKSTQVHMHLPTAFGRVVLRFKSPVTLDALIEALELHRRDVWGPR